MNDVVQMLVRTTAWDVVGWVGMALLLSTKGVRSRAGARPAVWLELFDIAGSACVAASAYLAGALPPAVLNVVWLGFSAWSLRNLVAVAQRGGTTPVSATDLPPAR